MNGASVVSGSPSATIPLAVGITPITILVTAEDGITTKSYTLDITRLPSTNADLASLAPSAGTLSPSFDAATLAYTASVSNSTASLSVVPTAAQADALITVNGASVVSGSPSAAIPLAVGITPITILVTAEDGIITKSYTLSVTRAPSANADLASLAPSSGTLSPSFDAATLAYTASVSNSTTSLTINPTAAQVDASLTVNGVASVSGSPSATIPLAVGITPITILVTAQDGATAKTYTLSITRAPSTNADLAALTPDVGTLSPAFSAATLDYTASVANATDALSITSTLAQADATLSVNGSAVVSGSPSAAIPLAVGMTPITILVSAQDGTTIKAYTLNVTRAPLPFAQWQLSSFGNSGEPNTAPGEDPDSDGIVNLLEYILGGIPVGPGSADTSILPTYSRTESAFVFSFHRTKSATLEFSTIVETSSTFAGNDWASVDNTNIAIQNIDSITELVTATIPLVSPVDKCFVRLKVQPKP